MSQAILKDTSGPWGDTPKVVDTSFEDNLNRERDAAVARVNEHAERKRQHKLQLDQLTKAVTVAEAALVEFESKKTFLLARKVQLQDQLLTLWPRDASNLVLQPNTSPLLAVVESHGTLLAIDAAMTDAPRVKKYLDSQLHAAKQALEAFQK